MISSRSEQELERSNMLGAAMNANQSKSERHKAQRKLIRRNLGS